MTRIEQIAHLITVRDGHVAVPRETQLMKYWAEHLKPQPLIEQVEVEAAIQLAVNWFRNRKVDASPSAPLPIATAPTVELDASNQLEHDLGTIAAWKSLQLQQFATANGLEFIPHPTNPGLTAMRARNAIANWLRRGNTLPSTP